jgi:hypothetical protein
VRNRRGIRLRGDDAPDGEAVGPCVGVSRQSLEQEFSEVRNGQATPKQPHKYVVWVIYTINATGGGRVQLTDNTTNEENPAYSPDGKKITYSGQDGPKGDFEIYTIKDGGGGRFNVTDNTRGDYDPSWGDRHDDDHNDDDHNDDDK